MARPLAGLVTSGFSASIIFSAATHARPTYDRLIARQEGGFAVHDPPYNVRIDGHVSGLGRVRHANLPWHPAR